MARETPAQTLARLAFIRDLALAIDLLLGGDHFRNSRTSPSQHGTDTAITRTLLSTDRSRLIILHRWESIDLGEPKYTVEVWRLGNRGDRRPMRRLYQLELLGAIEWRETRSLLFRTPTQQVLRWLEDEFIAAS